MFGPPPIDSAVTGFSAAPGTAQAVAQPVTAGASTAAKGLSAAQMGLIGAGISAVAGIAGAAVAGSAHVKGAQIAADAQRYQYAAALQAQQMDQEFKKTLLSYLPRLALMGAATIFAIVAIKTFSDSE